MNKTDIANGTVHKMPADLRKSLASDETVLGFWQDLTPLGRNEFICWVDSAKQIDTRERRIMRTNEELLEGKRRPCCWVGCIHRTDKAPSAWAQKVLIDKQSKPS